MFSGAGVAAVPQIASQALAAQAMRLCGGAAAAAESVGAHEIGRRAVVVTVVVGGLVRVVCRHAADIPAAGQDVITMPSDRCETSPVLSVSFQDVQRTYTGRLAQLD